MRDVDNKDDIRLVDLLFILYKRRWALILITAAFALGAVYYALKQPVIYRASALLMPTEGNQSTAIGPPFLIGGLIGGASASSTKMLILVQSYRLAESVFHELKPELMTNFYPKNWDAATQSWMKTTPDDKTEAPPEQILVNALKGSMEIELVSNTNLILYGHFTDPVLAVKVVNAYIEALRRLWNDIQLSVTWEGQRYVAKQLLNTKRAILEEGKILSQFYRRNHVSSESALTDVEVGVEFAGMGGVAGAETKALVKGVPVDVYLQYLSNRQAVLNGLSAEYEKVYFTSEIDSQERQQGFHIIDGPRLPLQRHKPHRKVIVILGTFIGGLCALSYVFFAETAVKLRRQWRMIVAVG